MRFPRLETSDLDGRRRVVPDDLEGDVRVIVLAFQRWHTALIDTWLPLLRSVEARDPRVTVWEIPALSRVYLPGRFYIDGGMRAGTPDPEDRRHTLTAYTDLGGLASDLGLPGFKTIHLYVLDPTGEIVWQARGELSEDAAAGLVQAIADARSVSAS